MGDVDAAGGAAVLQGGASLGHRNAVSTVVHHVERVAVSGIWKETLLVIAFVFVKNLVRLKEARRFAGFFHFYVGS